MFFMKLRIILFVTASILPLVQGVMAQEPITPNSVGIASNCIVMPVGRILLIGRNDFVGVLKFLNNEKRNDGTYSKYEYFEYVDGGITKTREGVISRRKPTHGFLDKLRSILQIHDSPFRYGDKLEFNKFELHAHAAEEHHSTVYFWNRPNEPDLKVRMAPTPWKEIAEVKLFDPRIKWFTYDAKDSWRVVPIDKLWD